MKHSPLHSILVIMQYTLRESLKNRILWIAGVFAVIGIGGASFVSDFSTVEYQRTEIALLSSFYRFCAVFFMIILVVSTVVREFSDKCLELYLSLPVSRLVYFIGKLGGFFITGFAVAAIYAGVMLIYDVSTAVVAFWFFSLVCELMLIAALSFFCAVTFNQQVTASVVTAFFFYLLARAGDDLVLLTKSDLVISTPGAAYMTTVIETLSVLLPGLGRFTRPEWLMYGDVVVAEVLPIIVAQTLIYTTLLSVASLFDFLRKNL